MATALGEAVRPQGRARPRQTKPARGRAAAFQAEQPPSLVVERAFDSCSSSGQASNGSSRLTAFEDRFCRFGLPLHSTLRGTPTGCGAWMPPTPGRGRALPAPRQPQAAVYESRRLSPSAVARSARPARHSFPGRRYRCCGRRRGRSHPRRDGRLSSPEYCELYVLKQPGGSRQPGSRIDRPYVAGSRRRC